MARPPHSVETCPICESKFTAAPYRKKSGGIKYKTCPSGHESSVYRLQKARVEPLPEPSKPAESILAKLRTVGIAGEREGFKMMTAALVGCYEQLIKTTPPASHAVVDGVLLTSVKMARQMLGVGS